MQTISLNSSGLSVTELVTLEEILISANPTIPSISFSTLTNVARVQIFSNPVLDIVSLPQLKAQTGATNKNLEIVNNAALSTVNLSALQSTTQALALNGNPSLATLQLDKLVFVGAYISLTGDTSLVTLNLPLLVTVASNVFFGFAASGCTALNNVSFPKYLPTNGSAQNFSNCALTEASVDHVLARCVANANYVGGTVNLSGGTNAAPGVQGQLDKATLQTRGVTVLTN